MNLNKLKLYFFNSVKFYVMYFIMSIFLFLNLSFFENKSFVLMFSLLDSFESLSLFDFLILLDWVSVLFIMILFMMTFSVGKFSMNYMRGDLFNIRFFYVLNLFVLSMVLLMIMPHYIFFLMGWDGLGFTSFLLMSYYKSKKAWASSLKTFIMNRLGDGMILGSVGFFLTQGHFFFFFENLKNFLFVFIILGLFTKSAQFPFSMWLPAAMAAPTPVSALVHSSTLVTAGMYVLFRLLFFFSNFILLLMCMLGVLTVFLGSLKAFISFDSKKVVAFSTLSNLGLMSVTLGLGLVGLSFFHLLNHGVSKALLFISVGDHMSKKSHNQDLRKFSKIWKSKMFSKFVGVWSKFSLIGFYYLAVFFSKDCILESVNKNYLYKLIFLMFFFFSVIFTFLYSFRFLKYWGNKMKKFFSFYFLKKKKYYLYKSEIFLFFLVLMMGNFLKMYFLSFGEGTLLVKLFLFMIFFFIFFKENKKKFVFMKKMVYFKGSASLWMKFLGSFFYKALDHGVFSNSNYLVKKKFSYWSKKVNYKSLTFFFFSFSYFIYFFLIVVLIFFMSLL